MDNKVEIIFDEQLLVGESPVWDEKSKKLYFVDIRGCCYYCMDYATGEYQKYDVGQMLGCLALCQNGDLLLGMEDGVYRKSKTGKCVLAHQDIKIKGDRFNDGKAGPDGCYYVGTAGENFSGAFYRLCNGELIELFDKCGCSNGLDWNERNSTMYYCDSREQKLEKFIFDANEHKLSNREKISEIPLSLGCGDGMTIDADGNLWLAIWGGSCVQHIDAKSGEVIETIELPATQVSSCCFAGDNLDELIVTTAAVRVDKNEQPHAGKIFKIKTNVKGKKFNRYIY